MLSPSRFPKIVPSHRNFSHAHSRRRRSAEDRGVYPQRAIHNLFSNAVKYNRDGGEVKCALSRDWQAIELTVANTGTRIPCAERERIFDRFYRSSDASESRIEGVGMGLSLAREIIAAHGGEIFVLDESEAGEGMAAFRVRLK